MVADNQRGGSGWSRAALAASCCAGFWGVAATGTSGLLAAAALSAALVFTIGAAMPDAVPARVRHPRTGHPAQDQRNYL